MHAISGSHDTAVNDMVCRKERSHGIIPRGAIDILEKPLDGNRPIFYMVWGSAGAYLGIVAYARALVGAP